MVTRAFCVICPFRIRPRSTIIAPRMGRLQGLFQALPIFKIKHAYVLRERPTYHFTSELRGHKRVRPIRRVIRHVRARAFNDVTINIYGRGSADKQKRRPTGVRSISFAFFRQVSTSGVGFRFYLVVVLRHFGEVTMLSIRERGEGLISVLFRPSNGLQIYVWGNTVRVRVHFSFAW